MAFLRKLSIRRKIIAIILTVTLASLIVGFSTEIFSNILASREELIDNISLDSRLISGFTVPTILFDDAGEAEKILYTLKNIPSVVAGATFDINKNLFAIYTTPGVDSSLVLNRPDTSVIFINKLLYITEPVISANEKIGEVLLIASTDVIKEQVLKHTGKILILFFISALIAVFLAIILERLVSQPIVELASVTKNISSSLDLSLRVKKKSDDETGMLYDSFNDLITSLEKRKEERDQAEGELKRERENLEKRVEERTRELNIAKERAEESDRLKSAFISNFSHEIRTPLNAIMGFTELLTEEGMATQEEKKFALGCINESKEDLIQLVENILDTSSIETNQYYLNKSEFQINKEIEPLKKHTEDLIARKEKHNIDFKLSIESTARIRIVTDGPRIILVLKQLLDNAVKYTDQGTIELGTFTSGLSEVGFYVKDTGCGIPETEKDKVFTRFYKVGSNKNKLYRGAGLGLTLVKGIVTSLGGKIWVESIPDSGSGFYFTLPCAISIIEKEVKKESPVDFKTSLAGKKILVAEDNMTNFFYISEVMRKNNMEGIHAKNGLEATELFRTMKFDLVLMDILMPEMDGVEAAKIIRGINPSVPIIALTAFDFVKEDPETKDLFNDFLQKPIPPLDLLKSLSGFLKGKGEGNGTEKFFK